MAERRATSAPISEREDPADRPAGLGDPAQPRRLRVLLPLPLSGAFSYSVPPGLELSPGDIVTVPLGRRDVVGVAWDSAPEEDGVPVGKLKPVVARLDLPPLPDAHRRFIDWVAGYSLAPPGAVLRMSLSSPGALTPPKPVRRVLHSGRPPLDCLKLTPARRRALAAAEDGFARSQAELARTAGVGVGVVKGLIEAGALDEVEIVPRLGIGEPNWQHQGPALSPDQASAAADLRAKVDSGFSVTLLDGVTGSGKTEVYFEAVAAALAAQRQVLVLLPEIALSAQWLERFAARFGTPPVAWHSDLKSSARQLTWRAVADGRARVVVGARSALFLPYPELGLIVVDEEHEAAFKQEDGVIYHARDMAVVRAHLGDFPIVLASATPSLESLVNVQTDKYSELRLPNRHGGAELPQVELIDLRRDPPRRDPEIGTSWLSPPLLQALEETLQSGAQALLYLNRRGYAPLTLCRACGHRFECPSCSAWLVEHRFLGRLVCHHCGYGMRVPEACPACGEVEALTPIGPGVERLAEEVSARFPAARTQIMSSDSLQGPADAAELIRRIQAHELDIVIGTQLAAKGHHFPLLTLVGVIDADLGLKGGDLRAGERTYHLLHQVAGRAGRAERPGRVLIQTYDPDHPVMQALVEGDRDRFLALEAEQRQIGGWPPFGRLAALILSAPDPDVVDQAARLVARSAPTLPGLRVLGPAEAPLAVLRGRHRRRFLIKARRDLPLQRLLRRWLTGLDLPNSVRLATDIDPYSFW
ncbi:primosomal protein N' [Algihabitans albus]|uniref:primosomal protein N' n=1 Tax=Algihabitans albus TaxID=2164067 RepID=UPI000E5CEE15|nr:primosomal protein N' [Algihabitans albus]